MIYGETFWGWNMAQHLLQMSSDVKNLSLGFTTTPDTVQQQKTSQRLFTSCRLLMKGWALSNGYLLRLSWPWEKCDWVTWPSRHHLSLPECYTRNKTKLKYTFVKYTHADRTTHMTHMHAHTHTHTHTHTHAHIHTLWTFAFFGYSRHIYDADLHVTWLHLVFLQTLKYTAFGVLFEFDIAVSKSLN